MDVHAKEKSIEIDKPPSACYRYYKNAQKNLVKTKDYRKWIKKSSSFINIQFGDSIQRKQPYELMVVIPDGEDTNDRGLIDAANDALRKAGVLPDTQKNYADKENIYTAEQVNKRVTPDYILIVLKGHWVRQ